MKHLIKKSCLVLALLVLVHNSLIPAYAVEVTTEETLPAVSEYIPAEQSVAETIPEETIAQEETVPQETEPEPAAVSTVHDVPLFLQTDYPDTMYAYGTIGSSGCSITSLAMVATYLTGYYYTPDVLADYFGGYGENNMQRLEHGSDVLQLPWKKAKDVIEVLDALREGDIVIALMNQNSIFTNSQHFIVLTGINEEGKVLVNDPYGPNYELWNLKDRLRDGFEEGAVIRGFSGGWIYDVSAMPEDPFIYVEEKPYVEPRYPEVQLTDAEVELMARLIWVEARGEPAEGQQAVAEVILNRLVAEGFPKTVDEIIYEKNQFPSTQFFEDADPGQAQYDAIRDALTGPYVLPKEVVHFAQYAENDKVWGQIGGHIFCYGWD